MKRQFFFGIPICEDSFQTGFITTHKLSLYIVSFMSLLIVIFYRQISQELEIDILSIGVGSVGLCSKNLGGCKCCCQDKILVGDNYLLVDSKSSVHVGPTIHIIPYCGCSKEKKKSHKSSHVKGSEPTSAYDISPPLSGSKNDPSVGPAAHAVVGEEPPSCRPETCLNGGRCVPGVDQSVRCICPTHTHGPRCKIIHREFTTDSKSRTQTIASWAWLPSLPACSHLHISMHVLTKNLHGILLYTSSTDTNSYNHFIALQIANGRPQLLVKLGASGSTATVTLNSTVHDNKWHRLDLLWRNRVSFIASSF